MESIVFYSFHILGDVINMKLIIAEKPDQGLKLASPFSFKKGMGM